MRSDDQDARWESLMAQSHQKVEPTGPAVVEPAPPEVADPGGGTGSPIDGPSTLSRLIGFIAPGTRSPGVLSVSAEAPLSPQPRDEIDLLFLERRHDDVIEALLNKGRLELPRHAWQFSRSCLETGQADLLLASLPGIAPRALQHRGFRTQHFLALISMDRIEEARALVRQSLLVGLYDLGMLLKVIGEYRRLGDPELVATLVRIVYRHWSPELTWKVRGVYLRNILLNLGDLDTLFLEAGPRPTARLTADDHFLLCNFALRAGSPGEALAHFNDGLAVHGLSPVALCDPDRHFSAHNISASPSGIQLGPLTTVAMPTYNAADTIIPALRGLSAQSYRNLEILVVDDGSSDATAALVRRYAAEVDSRVRFIAMGRNAGPYVARNRALSESRGTYFTCNDADDWSHPDKLSILIQALEGEGSHVAVQSRLVRLNPDNGIKPKQQGYAHNDLSSTLFRRVPVVGRIGFFEPARFGADSEYAARLQIAFGETSIRSVPKPLLVAHWADNTLSSASSTGITDGGLFSPRRAAYRHGYRLRLARGEGGFRDRDAAGIE